MTKNMHCYGVRFPFEIANLSFQIKSAGTDTTLTDSVPP